MSRSPDRARQFTREEVEDVDTVAVEEREGFAIMDVKVDGDEVEDENEFLGGLVNLQFIFVSPYIIFGMAVIAMCFSLMQEKVVRGLLALGRKVGLFKSEGS